MVKITLKGKRLHDAEDINKNVIDELNAVPLEASAKFFSKTFLNDSTFIFK
jgi:hypothetical protein